jgi:NAD(P)-dependent dehydrogenase (short-subunit alcohol dehydrogenase family)
MIDINLKGTMALTKSCIGEMLTNHWGRIISITSIVGKSGFRGLSVYSMTKTGLDGFTRSLARELGDRGHYGKFHCAGPFRNRDDTRTVSSAERANRTPNAGGGLDEANLLHGSLD